MKISRRAGVAIAILAAVSLVLIASHRIWLTWFGSYLVEQQTPEKADIIVVLGGDLKGMRILVGARLARQGYAPLVLVSGSGPIYGKHESELAVGWAVANGFDERMFVKVPFPATSTEDEAEHVGQKLRELHVRRFLLVTSNFHTRRAARIFREKVSGVPFRVVASPDKYFTVDGWWKSREGQKTFLNEWAKTVANWLGD